MVYKDVSFATTAISLGTVPEHAKGKVMSIQIDDSTAGAKTLYFHDVFTPSASNGVAVPTAVTKTWFQLTLAGGVPYNFSESDMEGIELLGALDVSCNQAAAGSNIAVNLKYI